MLRSRVWIIFAVILLSSAAHAAIPVLLVAGTSFAPVDLLPDRLQGQASQIAPDMSVEGIHFAPVRELAKQAGVELAWDASSQTLVVHTPSGPMRLRALPPLRFWKDPAIKVRSEYSARLETVTCERIVDGDTIKLTDDRRVRYIGVDTPETKHPNRPVEYFGREASRFNHRLVSGRRLILEYDIEAKDRYGRTLAYVHTVDTFVNARLLAGGYAQVSTYPPNVRYVPIFRWLQAQARERAVGLWERQPEEQNSTEQSNGRFVGSRNSDVYHAPDCQWAKRISPANRIWFESPEDARQHDYRPCRVCNP